MTAPVPAQPHGAQTPPSANELAQHVAEILAAGWAIGKAADAIAALLAPWKVGGAAVLAALGLARHAHRPRTQLARHGIDRSVPRAADVARAAAAADLYFRAAYVVNAAWRIQGNIDGGKSTAEALRAEAKHYAAHRAARENRLEVAARVGKAAALHGKLLGWYRDAASDSEAECIAADGANFYADRPPLIGLPGAVHPHCRCRPGPPHATRMMVDQAVAGLHASETSAGRASVRVAARRAS